jgi:hypothetical protein
MQGSRTTSARVFFWASSLAALTSCGSCGRPTNAIVDVQVLDRMTVVQGAPIKIDHRALDAATKEAIKKLPGFVLREAKPGEAEWQLTVEVELTGEREARDPDAGTLIEGQVHRAVGVAVTLVEIKPAEEKSAGSPKTRYEMEALVERDVSKATTYDALAAEAVNDGIESIRAGFELQGASDDKIVESMKSKNHGTRARAIIIAGERKLKAAVPVLMDIVKNEEEDQGAVLKAIGALVAIGDDRAVGALIDAGRRRTTAYLNQILFAVAALGGKEAEAYLFTVSTGHTDPEIRKNANDALEELQRRKEGKRKTQDGTNKEE